MYSIELQILEGDFDSNSSHTPKLFLPPFSTYVSRAKVTLTCLRSCFQVTEITVKQKS